MNALCIIFSEKTSQNNPISMMVMISLNFFGRKEWIFLTKYCALCIIYLFNQQNYLSNYYLVNLKDNIVRENP